MARAAGKARLVALATVTVAMAAGLSACGSSSKSASGTTASTSASTTSAATSTAASTSPAPVTSTTSSPSEPSSSSPAPLPSTTTESTSPPDFSYHGSDPDVCPWVKAGDLAKATRHPIDTVEVATAANGIKTCKFGPPPAAPGALFDPMYVDLTYVGGPGANTSSYLDQALADNNAKNPQPVSGLGVKALYAAPRLYVLTKHGVAIIASAAARSDNGGDPDKDIDIAAFHGAEHSF